MKKIALLLCLLSLSAVAQTNSMFYMKDGSTIEGDYRSFDPDVKGKTITYTAPGKMEELKVKVEDLDYAIVGGSKYKSFGKRGYYVLAEANGKYLAVQATQLNQTLTGNSPSSLSLESTFFQYILFVLDDQYKIIDKIIFTQYPSKGKTKTRGEVPAFVRKYFGDCDGLIQRLSRYENKDDLNLEICKFAETAVYFDCNK